MTGWFYNLFISMFQSCKDYGRVILKGCIHYEAPFGFKQNLDFSRTCDRAPRLLNKVYGT